jgi:hypothetical protein
MNEDNFEVYDGVEVAPPVLKIKRPDRLGTVEDLPKEEMASIDELERMVYQQEFAPILALPVPDIKWTGRPNIDENGKPDWGAFGTIDFDRYKSFDRAMYRADKLKEQLKDLIIMASIINSRIQGTVKFKVLKYVKQGIIETDSIKNSDMRQLAKLFLRILRLRKEIAKLQEKSRQRKQQQYEKWLDSLG